MRTTDSRLILWCSIIVGAALLLLIAAIFLPSTMSVLHRALRPNQSTQLVETESEKSQTADVPAEPVGELRSFTGHTASVQSVAYSPSGKTILSASFDDTVRLWDVQTGLETTRIGPLQGALDQVTSVGFCADSRRVVLGTYGPSIWIWDIETGQAILRSQYPASTSLGTCRIAVSADDRFVLSGFSPGIFAGYGGGGRRLATFELFDLQAGKDLGRFGEYDKPVHCVAISPDGRRALSGEGYSTGSGNWKDCVVRIWDVTTGKETRRLEGHSAIVESVSFSPDGQLALSGSHDETVRVWDIASGKELTRFDQHTSRVNCAIFCYDGRRALSAGGDCTMRLWDVSTGNELQRFDGHTGSINAISLSPDGRRAVSVSDDATIRLWTLPK